MADDITLKMNVDTSDAVWAIDKFNESAEKAFKSSNTSTQAWGQSLNKVTTQMTKIVSQMSDLEAGKLPAYVATKLQSELKKTNAEITKTEKYLDKLQKNPVKTTEYANWENKLKDVNAELKTAENTLKGYNKSDAMTNEFIGAQREVDKLTRKLQDALAVTNRFESIGVVTGSEYDAAVAEVNKYENSLRTAESALQTLKDAGLQFKDQAGYDKAATDVSNLKAQAEVAKTAITELENSGKKWDTTEIDKTNIKLNDLYNNANKIKTTLNTPYTGDYTQSNEYQQLASRLTDCYNKGTILDNKINDINGDLRKTSGSSSTFKNSFTNAANSIISKLRSIKGETGKTQTSHNKSFKSMLTTVLKYGFGIRSIFLLYKKVRSTISTGLTEMSKQFSDVADDVYTLKNSWSGFKASIVSAFQPILSYVVPVLTTLINYLTSAMNAIANFFALLTGQSYYYKAVKGNESVADSIGSTGSAAEDANEELAEYDDLIVIDQDSSSGGGGGGGSSSSDAWQWEKTNVEASTLADQLSNMWDVFKSAWENKGQAVIDAATTAFNNVKSLISTIADTIYSVFVSGTGQTWVESVLTLFTSILTTIGLIAEAWETAWKKDGNGYKLVESVFNMFTSINSTIATIQDSWNKAWTSDDTGVNIISNVLNTLTSIYNTITNISDNFRTAWETAGVGDEIMDTILGIVEDISGFISTIASDTEEWSENLDFYPLLDSVKNVLNSCRKALDLILTAAESLYKQYILKIVEHITESNIPDILNSVSEEVDGIVDSLDGFDWDHFFSTLESITELGLDNLTEIFKEKLSDLANVAKFAAEEITLLQKAIKTLESLGGANTLLSKIWNWLKKILDIVQSWTFSWENLFPGAGKVIESINTIQEAWESLKDLFDGGDYEGWGSDIFDGLVTGFSSGDWSDAIHSIWTTFIDTLKSVFGIGSPAKNVKPYGAYIFDGLIEGIKSKFDSIKTTISTIYTKFVSAIKEKFSNFSISNVVTGLGNVAINIVTTLSGGITKLADFTGLNTTLNNIKTKYTTMKAKLTTTLSGAFNKITGEGSTLSTLATKWSELKNSWTDKLATLKANVGGQMSQVSDITTWQTYFATLKSTWSDKVAYMKAYVGGQVSSMDDIAGDKSTSWKTRFSNFVNNIWNDDTATMKAEATVGGTSDGKLANFVSGGTWHDRFTSFKDLWSKTYTTTMKATANIGGSTDDSLSNFSDNTGTKWRKKFTDFQSLWNTTTTATFNASYKDADTSSTGYQNYVTLKNSWTDAHADFNVSYTDASTSSQGYTDYCNLWNNWQDKTAKFTVAYDASAQEGLTTMANTVLRKIYDAMDASGIKLKQKVWAAQGGIVNYPVYAGEAGQEAIIPLERNLGWMDKMATAISDKVANIGLPDIVTGKILPSTTEFNTMLEASTKNIEAILQAILDRLDRLESNDSNHPSIMLQLDSRTVAEVVWDETEKRYKQTGIRYAY